MPLILEPGTSEALVVDCPEGYRWKIGGVYSSEHSGIRDVIGRIQLAYREKDLRLLGATNSRSFSVSGFLQSDAIPEGEIEREPTPSQEP